MNHLKFLLLVTILFSSNTAFSAGTPQKRSEYARQYVNNYDRIQVGARAKAEGDTLHIYLKYNLDDFVVGVARHDLADWKAL